MSYEAFHLPPPSNHGFRSLIKGFVLLIFDTTSDCVDTHEHPLAPIVCTYKPIYRTKDRQVGQWSDAVTVSVGR